MGKQFSDVSCAYGAPMGRSEDHKYDEVPRSISCFKVMLDSGGYDDGGAYWGWGSEALYCLRQDDTTYREFFRAISRDDAIDKSGVPNEYLKRPKAKNKVAR